MSHPSRLLIVAVSGRALAQSARRGRLPSGRARSLRRSGYPAASSACRPIGVPGTLRIDATRLLDAARRLAPGAGLVYGSGFEGRPALLDRLSRGRTLFGNRPATVASVRDPDRFFPLLRRLGISPPGGAAHPPAAAGLAAQTSGRGRGTGRYFPLAAQPARGADYYQRIESGDSLSATFLANGRRAMVLGFNRQWTAPGPAALPVWGRGRRTHPSAPAPPRDRGRPRRTGRRDRSRRPQRPRLHPAAGRVAGLSSTRGPRPRSSCTTWITPADCSNGTGGLRRTSCRSARRCLAPCGATRSCTLTRRPMRR